jgi:excisionase family DNA binding protein
LQTRLNNRVDPKTSSLITSISGSQKYARKKHTGNMVRDLPVWALQQQSSPELCDDIASVAGQSQVGSDPLVPLMTIGETAAVLRVAPRTIRRMIERGELKAVRVGRSIRIRPGEIRQIICGD